MLTMVKFFYYVALFWYGYPGSGGLRGQKGLFWGWKRA
jgi:hypothetical protein